MKLEFNDVETIEVNSDLLTSCQVKQYFETEKRPIGKQNLYWWLRCYPNYINDNVGVSIHTSFGGLSIRHVTTIDRSDIKESGGGYYKEHFLCNHPLLAPHEKIRTGTIIQDNVFVIRCEVNIKIALDEARIDNLNNIIEDTAIIKLKRKTMEEFDLGEHIDGEKRTVAGITWWTKCYLSGIKFQNECYNVDVFFNFNNAPEKTHFSCGLSINGVFVQKSTDTIYLAERPISFSHNQLQGADHEDDIVDLVCKVAFLKPVNQKSPKKHIVLVKPTTSITRLKDSVTFSIMECQLNLECQPNVNAVGDFDSTPKRFAEGSDKHKWRVLYFPVGILEYAKNHISLIVEASTTETKTVIMIGEITILGTPFSKKFKMFVEEDSNIAFPKLITKNFSVLMVLLINKSRLCAKLYLRTKLNVLKTLRKQKTFYFLRITKCVINKLRFNHKKGVHQLKKKQNGLKQNYIDNY